MKSTPVSDKNSIKQLKDFLRINKLPVEDLDDEKLNHESFFLYKKDDGNLIGSGGLEFYGSSALIRSVAVDSSLRGMQYGQQIVYDLKKRAMQQGSTSMYLLTETAPDFFSKNGFEKIDRDDAPEELKSSSEFSHMCPTTAVCMKLDL